MTEQQLHLELSHLTVEAMLAIREALHELASPHVHAAIRRHLWGRLSRIAVEGWPHRMVKLSGREYEVVAYHDVRVMDGGDHALREVLEVPGLGTEYRCSCGAATDTPGRDRMVMRWRRATSVTVGVWSTAVIDGIPHYQVCAYAKAADDRDHGPVESYEADRVRCLCGYSSTPKLLPAY